MYKIFIDQMLRTAESYNKTIGKFPKQGHMLIGQRNAELNGMIKIALNLPDINSKEFQILIDLQNKITGMQ